MSNEQEWLAEFNGKTIRNIRSQFEGERFLPHVVLEFEDDSSYEIHVKPNIFFEGCHINTIRRAQPVSEVIEGLDEMPNGNELVVMEVACDTFTMFTLRAQHGRHSNKDFPFVLSKVAA